MQPVIYLIFFAVPLMLLKSIFCLFLHSSLNRLPPAQRRIAPAASWVLVFPVVAQIFNFYYWPKFCRSYKAYFESIGRGDEMGHCGMYLALFYSCISLISTLSDMFIMTKDYGPSWTAALVATLLLTFKIWQMRKNVHSEIGASVEASADSSPWLAGGLVMGIAIPVVLSIVALTVFVALIFLLKGLRGAR